jgi:hypothetical protein
MHRMGQRKQRIERSFQGSAMKSPYVCAVCGGSIQIGRHKSGWRHVDESRSDHRVRRIERVEYEQLKAGAASEGANAELNGETK